MDKIEAPSKMWYECKCADMRHFAAITRIRGEGVRYLCAKFLSQPAVRFIRAYGTNKKNQLYGDGAIPNRTSTQFSGCDNLILAIVMLNFADDLSYRQMVDRMNQWPEYVDADGVSYYDDYVLKHYAFDPSVAKYIGSWLYTFHAEVFPLFLNANPDWVRPPPTLTDEWIENHKLNIPWQHLSYISREIGICCIAKNNEKNWKVVVEFAGMKALSNLCIIFVLVFNFCVCLWCVSTAIFVCLWCVCDLTLSFGLI